jgi:hypothetical protein
MFEKSPSIAAGLIEIDRPDDPGGPNDRDKEGPASGDGMTPGGPHGGSGPRPPQ